MTTKFGRDLSLGDEFFIEVRFWVSYGLVCFCILLMSVYKKYLYLSFIEGWFTIV